MWQVVTAVKISTRYYVGRGVGITARAEGLILVTKPHGFL